MADIFTEVDEDLRREKLEKLWKKTAPYIIGVAIIFIGGMAGRVYWKEYQEAERIAQSDRYQTALAELAEGREAEALAALQTLGQESKHGYDLLSRLQSASLLIQAGKVEESLAAYDAIAANSSYNQRYRDYASLMGGMLVLDQTRYDEARVRLEPLAGGDGSWSYSARELLGLMAMEMQDWEQAEATFLELSLDAESPQELQGRAREYLQMIDIKKPQNSLIDSEPLAEAEETVAEEDSAEDRNQ